MRGSKFHLAAIFFAVAVFANSSVAQTALSATSPIIVDDFEGNEITNLFGGRANVYVKAPSRIMVSRAPGRGVSDHNQSLLIHYDKSNVGGPYGQGGWCGYYTLLKNDKADTQAGERVYFDATTYKAITFWVRGRTGEENFMVGLADRHWDKIGDSLKSEEIGTYLPTGHVTTEWQKATIPLDVFFLDYMNLSSIAFAFEADCFAEGKGDGFVYIDDLVLE